MAQLRKTQTSNAVELDFPLFLLYLAKDFHGMVKYFRCLYTELAVVCCCCLGGMLVNSPLANPTKAPVLPAIPLLIVSSILCLEIAGVLF